MVGEIWHVILRWFMCLTAQEWLYVLLFTVVAGMFCLRGYGSRNSY